MKVKHYSFKNGARLKTKVTADEVMGEMERVRKKRGLSSRSLLDESKPKKAVLHGEFTWDDKKAADQWRLEEAGMLMRVVEVVYDEGPDEPQRALVIHERPSDGALYAPVHEVLERRSSRDNLIIELLRDLQAFRRRFAMVSELSHVVPVIDDIVAKVEEAIADDQEQPKKRRRK